MVFIKLDHTWHQPEPCYCLPTTLKVLFTNQLNLQHSFQVWKNKTNCTHYGAPKTAIRGLEPWLSKQKIQIFEQAALTEKDLRALLEDGYLPLLPLPLNYRDEGQEPYIDEQGRHWDHSVIVVGVEDGSVYIYDSFVEPSRTSLPKHNVKVVIPIAAFLKVWENNERKAYWFKKALKEDREITEYI
jgi:hypothetical protein